MREFAGVAEIQAPPERVWTILLDVEHWPEWTRSMNSVRRLDSGAFGVGSRTEVRQPKLAPAIWEVTELDERTHTFTWVSRHAGICASGRHQVEAVGQSSRVTLSIEFSGFLAPLIALLTGSLTARYVTMELNGLKARSESGG